MLAPGDWHFGAMEFNAAEVNQALRITASSPAWVRFYASEAHRDADAARGAMTPTGDHGVLLEAHLEASSLTQVLSPAASLFNITELAGPIFYAVENMSADTVPVTVTVLAKGLPGAALGGSDAAVYTRTTPSIANGATNVGSMVLSSAEVHQALKISSDVPARVRFYATTAQRTADLARPLGTDPTGNHGVLLDVVLRSEEDLQKILTPSPLLFDSTAFGAVPVTITNMSGATDTVTVSLTAKGV